MGFTRGGSRFGSGSHGERQGPVHTGRGRSPAIGSQVQIWSSVSLIWQLGHRTEEKPKLATETVMTQMTLGYEDWHQD